LISIRIQRNQTQQDKQMRNPDQRNEQLIEQLYEGILTEDGWRRALEGIVEITGSGTVNTIMFKPQTQTACIAEFVGYDSETMAAYGAYYHQIDEALPFAPIVPLGHWYHDERDIGQERMRRSEYYQDFALRHDLSTTISNHLLAIDGMDAYITLYRRPGQPNYTDADLRAYSQTFIPHVQRAARLRIELDRATGGANLSALALDRLPMAVLVLDEQARILQTNTQAQTLMRRAPQLAVQHGRLQPQGMKPGEFDHLLQTACGRHGPAVAGGARPHSPAPHPRGGRQKHTLQCLVLPLPVPASALNPWARPLALVLLREFDPLHSAQPQPQLLRQLFDLTPAESKVAQALCQGDTPTQLAGRLGISIHTVRSHLSVIFAKTGTVRQADLVRLLTLLSAADGGG
jgi:DNA-binding CsgD family transcriptional regulator/PAS domain-containing protein